MLTAVRTFGRPAVRPAGRPPLIAATSVREKPRDATQYGGKPYGTDFQTS